MQRLFCFQILICVSILSGFTQEKTSHCSKIKTLITVLDNTHYKPAKINNQTSDIVLDNFINTLDPFGLILLEKDIQLFRNFYNNNEKAFHQNTCDMLNTFIPLFKSRLLHADSVIQITSIDPSALTKQETLDCATTDTFSFVSTEGELHERWKYWLKFNYLMEIINDSTLFDVSGQIIHDSLTTRWEQLSTEIKKEKSCRLDHFINHHNGFEKFITTTLLNAIAQIYDPHTTYFPRDEKELFERDISKESLSFGIQLSASHNGNIMIAKLVPGGPAWKSGKLNAGDELLRITWPDGETTNLSCSSITEVNKMLFSSESKEIELTVKKVNGQTKTVSLVKEALLVDENMINSFLLEGDYRIGYIKLPGFYTHIRQDVRAGCANDMAKEIIKLRQEAVAGIIIDVRNNGGGSMFEALDLIGIFIDEGPLSMTKTSDGAVDIHKDNNRGSIYNGPLLILVNQFSASAAEMLAAALQDYNRAVIVGSTTYGKATAQRLIPLDNSITDHKNISPQAFQNNNDFIKVTIEKFYRVTGKSHQKSGVTPDIILPDITGYMDYNESSTPFALNNDRISKAITYQPFSPLPLYQLATKSEKRVNNDDQFKEISKLCDSLTVFYDKKQPSLEINTLKKNTTRMYNMLEKVESLSQHESSAYQVKNCTFDEWLFQMNNYRKKMNNSLINNIQQDIYIEEAFFILKDLIFIQKNN